MDDQIPQNKKMVPIIAGVLLIAFIVGGYYVLMRDANPISHTGRNPDIAGLIDLWEIQDSKIYASVAPGGKKPVRHTITVEPSTQYIYRKGRRGDSERPESPGALANISDGIYVNIFLKPNTKTADTIIYADWPL